MAGIKGLIARVKRLEPKTSAEQRKEWGEKFERDCMFGAIAGRYCLQDMPVVARVVRQWAEQGAIKLR